MFQNTDQTLLVFLCAPWNVSQLFVPACLGQLVGGAIWLLVLMKVRGQLTNKANKRPGKANNEAPTKTKWLSKTKS